MCGIAGYSRNLERSSIPNGRDFARALTLAIEPRGKHATGGAWWERSDPANVWYSKMEGPARHVVDRLALPAEGITTAAMHTRFATLGKSSDLDNVHPVVAGAITCTHNGRVENHDELIELTGLARIGQVDSWSIPALLSQQDELGADHPKELLELIHGVAAIAWLDANEEGVLHLARCSTRPLFIGWTRRSDLVYSSTRKTLEAGARRGKVGVHDIMEVPEGTYMRISDGKFDEWDTFKVNPPKEPAIDMDMPGAGRAYPRAPLFAAQSFDPDEDTSLLDESLWADEQRRSRSVLAGIDGGLHDDPFDDDPFDGSNDDGLIDPYGDGIDWDNLVPRRGWRS